MTESDTSFFFHSNLAQPHTFVLESIEFEYGHHRTEWMAKKIDGVKRFFATQLPKDMSPLMLTHAPEGAMEAVVKNLCVSGSVYTRKNSRWARILDAFEYTYEPVESATTGEAFFLLDETHDVETIISIKKQHPNSRVILDTSDSFAILPIKWVNLPIDGLLISPERGLGGIPGATVVALVNDIFSDETLVSRMETNNSYTFDFIKYFESAKKNDTPYSPDISATVALHAAIKVIEAGGGLEKHIERLSKVRTAIKSVCKIIGEINQPTPTQTVLKLPKNLEAQKIFEELESRKILLESFDTENNTLTIGHTGYIDPAAASSLLDALVSASGVESVEVDLPEAVMISASEYVYPDSFIVKERELLELAEEKASELSDPKLKEIIIRSASELFGDPSPNEMFSYTGRTVGFIGAGRTVKATIKYCKEMGIKKFIVFSPSLKKSLGDGSENNELTYWHEQGVNVAKDATDVFMTAETVVLLPTYYDAYGALVLGKGDEYINEAMVSNELLEAIKEKGKMDLLINASARPKIIDRKALAAHVKTGWLRFISDETPEADDPLSISPDVSMTGHVGGSAQNTKKMIAENTREIIAQILAALTKSKLKGTGYQINYINKHLEPDTGWRIESAAVNGPIRFLLTDIFDLATIDFSGLEKEFGTTIEIRDLSSEQTRPERLAEEIGEFKPHFMMIRTKTVISKKIADALIALPEFFGVIRPGVGIENIYEGMQALSKNGIQVMNEPFGNSAAVGEMTTRFITRGIKKVILTPGPTPHNRDVFKAAQNYEPQTTKRFAEVFSYVSDEMLESWLQLKRGALILSTPSTGLMEAGVQNLTTEDETGLVIAHGKFGNRFIDICKRNSRKVHAMDVADGDWGHAYSVDEVSEKITELEAKGETISFICLQQNETSSGVSYSEEQLGAIATEAKKHNPSCLIILDCVSGLCAHKLDFTQVPIDYIVTGSQKGIGVSSGISYSVMSDQAVTKMLALADYDKDIDALVNDPEREAVIHRFNTKQKVFYFSILRHYVNLKLGILPPNSSVFHIACTGLSLKLLSESGAEAISEAATEKQEMVLNFVSEMGLESQVRSDFKSKSVTAFFLPEGVNATDFRKELEERYGFMVSGAQNQTLKPRLIRIGHIGFISKHDTPKLIRSLKILLHEKTVV